MEIVSVIIPVYNHVEELNATLRALFAQSYQDFEVIVVDDGSTDNLVSILMEWGDKITVINKKHEGAPAARNTGVRKAQGEYLLFLDADVELRRDALEQFVQALRRNPNFAFAYSSFKFGFKNFAGRAWDLSELKNKNFIHTTSLIRKESFPGFDESLKRFQDWDLWLTIMEKGDKGIFIPDILFRIKTRRQGISKWLPKIAYKLPWLKAVKEYNRAAEIIRKKHGI